MVNVHLSWIKKIPGKKNTRPLNLEKEEEVGKERNMAIASTLLSSSFRSLPSPPIPNPSKVSSIPISHFLVVNVLQLKDSIFFFLVIFSTVERFNLFSLW